MNCFARCLAHAVLSLFASLTPLHASDHFSPPGDAIAPVGDAPRLTRVSCCDGVVIRRDPGASAPQLGVLQRSQQAWVTNLSGLGLPACLSSAAGCGNVWAEAFFPDANVTGHVPLEALFRRGLILTEGRLQLEVGYQRLFGALADAVEQGLISPEGCGDPGNTRRFSASQVGGRDSVVSLDQMGRTICDDALATLPPASLISCLHVDRDSEVFQRCRYAQTRECNGPVPARAPSANLSFCVEVAAGAPTMCADCRRWYDATGQNATGWQPITALTDACTERYERNGFCAVPGQGSSGSGGGGGGGGRFGDTHAAGNGFGTEGDGGSTDPFDLPDPDAPDRSVPEAPSDLAAAGRTQQGTSQCTDACFNHVEAWMGAVCERYIGSGDSKHLGDIRDYECGELPVGRTHPLFGLNMDTGEQSGTPDQDWKWLATTKLKGLSQSLILSMGRTGSQRSATVRVNDLSRREDGREIEIGPLLRHNSVWMALEPRRWEGRDALQARVCVYLPGTAIRSSRVHTQDEDSLRFLIKSVDLGGVDLESVHYCQGFNIWANADHKLRVRPAEDPAVLPWIVPGTLQGVDVEYSALVNVATIAVPFLNALLISLQVATEVVESYSASADANAIAQFALIAAHDRFGREIAPHVETAVKDAVDTLADSFDAPDLLSRICDALLPTINAGQQGFYLTQYLRWQCDGFAADPNFRAFLPHETSAAQGCYSQERFIKPSDARQTWWWTPYTGQSWGFNLAPSADRGCRIVGDMGTRLDRDTWPLLICAMTTQNTWLNSPQFPNSAALNTAIQRNCGGFVASTGRALYGNGQDLLTLYLEANAP